VAFWRTSSRSFTILSWFEIKFVIYIKCVSQKEKHYYHCMILWLYIVWTEKLKRNSKKNLAKIEWSYWVGYLLLCSYSTEVFSNIAWTLQCCYNVAGMICAVWTFLTFIHRNVISRVISCTYIRIAAFWYFIPYFYGSQNIWI